VCRCVLGLFLLCFIVVSAKLHKRRRRRQYLQAELKAEAKRAAQLALADGVHDLSQLSDPQVGPRPLPPAHASQRHVCLHPCAFATPYTPSCWCQIAVRELANHSPSPVHMPLLDHAVAQRASAPLSPR
jgi:hypothetical protein